MAQFKKVRPGDPLVIPSKTWNALMDNASAAQNVSPPSQLNVENKSPLLAGQIWVKSTSLLPFDRFEIGELTTSVFAPVTDLQEFQNRFIINMKAPTKEGQAKFAILAEPCQTGDICRAWVFGLCPVKVFMRDPDDLHADVQKTGTTKRQKRLISVSGGSARIIWTEGLGIGSQWALVHLGNGRSGSVFPVSLIKVSGSQGTGTTPATFLYDVFDKLSAESLLRSTDPTGLPHSLPRTLGRVTPALSGMAFINSNGQVVLSYINEIYPRRVCNS